MSGDEPGPELVSIPRLWVATAVDLLHDMERELWRADATGPYLSEVSETADTLERALDARTVCQNDERMKTYGLFTENRQDPNQYYMMCGGPVTIDSSDMSRTKRKRKIVERVRTEYDFEGEIVEEETFVAEFAAFPEPATER